MSKKLEDIDMTKNKEMKLPKEIQEKILADVQKELDSISVINEKGNLLNLYEIETKVADIGRRYKQQLIEEISQYESDELNKKKL